MEGKVIIVFSAGDFDCIADKNQHLAEFLALIRSTPDLLTLYESVQKDSSLTISASVVAAGGGGGVSSTFSGDASVRMDQS